MLPTYRAGDIVVVRRSPDYQVGEVVAYWDPGLQSIILHRIVGTVDGRFVTRGDHNAWEDPYQPTKDEILGKAVLQIPNAAGYVAWVKRPAVYFSILAVVGIAWVVFELRDMRTQTRRRRRVRGRASRHAKHPSGGSVLASSYRLFFYLTAALGVLLLGWGVYLAQSPRVESIMQVLTFIQRGTFSYEADVSQSSAYPDGTVKTGDPLFLELLPAVSVVFDYEVQGQTLTNAGGKAEMVAILRGQSGWSRTYSLEEPFSFEGMVVHLEGTLPLAQMRQDVETLQQETGYRFDRYTLTIRPQVQQQGILAGKPVESLFAPELTFEWEPLIAKLAFTDADKLKVILNPEKTGNISLTAQIPRRIRILEWEPTVETVWKAAMLAALVLFLTAGFAYRRWQRALWMDPLKLWQIRAGYLWVESRGLGHISQGANVVWLEDFDSILKVARDYERFLFHEELEDGQHFFVVRDLDVIYAFKGSPRRVERLSHLRDISREVT